MRTRYSNGDLENEKATLKGTGAVVAVTGRREALCKGLRHKDWTGYRPAREEVVRLNHH